MSGSQAAELNSQEKVSAQYISLDEARELLETTEDELQELIREGHLFAFKLGGQHLRLRREQVSEVKAKWRINRELFPEEAKFDSHVWSVDKPGIFERIKDFLYFNDFYIVCLIVIASLIYLILSSQ